MSDTKHTPEAWRRGQSADLWIYSGERLIAKVCPNNPHAGADARLIASGPTMLAAISFAKKHWPHTDVFLGEPPPHGTCPTCRSSAKISLYADKPITEGGGKIPLQRCADTWHYPERHKMQNYRNPGDSTPYDGPYYVFDERCERCKFDRMTSG